MRWLSVDVTFLTGRYHGRRREGAEAEWPPAPHRLFQALVASGHLGARMRDWSDAKAHALRWLERRAPPEIAAPPARKASSFVLSVPNNDMDVSDWVKKGGKPSSALRTMKLVRPTLLDGDGQVHFLWPIADNEWPEAQPYAEVLCSEARHLHSLGLGFDLVAGNGRLMHDEEKRALAGEIWIADMAGRSARVPCAGSFDEIDSRHRIFLKRVAGGRNRYVDPPEPPRMVRWVTYRRRTESHSRRVHAFDLVMENGAFASFDPRRTIHVAAWARHAAHRAAERLGLDKSFVERFVCGHGPDEAAKNDRFSYLPLPTIAPKGRDGRIRRLLLAEPFGPAEPRAAAVARALAGASLAEEEAGEVMADLREVPDPEHEARIYPQYLQAATVWGSVTPVVLPGLDDKRSRKATALIVKALAQAGYTVPVTEIAVQPEPVFPGAEMAGRYIAPEHLKKWPRVHAIVTFAQPVRGPLAIGGGRHSGLGVFAGIE